MQFLNIIWTELNWTNPIRGSFSANEFCIFRNSTLEIDPFGSDIFSPNAFVVKLIWTLFWRKVIFKIP